MSNFFLAPVHAMWSSITIIIVGTLVFSCLLRNWLNVLRPIGAVDMDTQVTRSVLKFSPLPIAVLDKSGAVSYVNEGICQMTGYKSEEMKYTPFLQMLDSSSRTQMSSQFEKALNGSMGQTSVKMMHKSGIPLHVQLVSAPFTVDGYVKGVLLIGQDMSDQNINRERIRYMAYYDDMTGLPNRRMFMNQLAEALEHANKHGQTIALLYLDIDRFKLVNDSFGREVGDMLLLQVAERLTRIVSEQDMAARMEGDEFAVLFTEMGPQEEVMARTQSLVQMLEEPFELQGFPLNMTASIGVATNEAQDNAGTLLKKADMALAKMKENGKNGCLLYSKEWNDSSLERLTLQHELRQGIQRKEFVLHYQPQYHISSGTIIGVEALVRWAHPTRGMVPPDRFIPLAEENGLIVQLGDWVLEEACTQNKAWQDAGLPAIPVSVNLSIRQFMQQNLTEKVAQVLDKTGLEARFLDLEITETMTMDVSRANKCLQELSNLGVGISVDDFGTGYSSLHYLKNLPIARLKIDRSFVREIELDSSNAAIVATIIAMAHNLNLQVIAEGVETREQMEFLQKHRCDEMQGYYWSPPVAGASIGQMLAQGGS
ncbi:EAL domain-containing protein [Paenibacillaceae bacterium]|nr:EAL domain-containing protein [Paenibacillaceae bacterium]